MWEYQISFESEGACKFATNLARANIKNAAVIASHSNIDHKLLLAFREGATGENIAQVRYIIKTTILNYFKAQYFLKHISSLEDINDVKRDAFINVLCAFDADFDSTYIQNHLKVLPEKLAFESFVFFSLKLLVKKWNEVIFLANGNSKFLQVNENYSELYRFILNTLPCNINSVELYLKNNVFFLFSQNKEKLIFKTTKRQKSEADLIKKMVALCPENINVHCGKIEDNMTLHVLFDIFEGRIKHHKI